MKVIMPQWETLQSLFTGKVAWIFISSPWFSTEAIQKLTDFLPTQEIRQIQKMEVWFRTSVEDHLTGMTDYGSLLEFFERVEEEIGEEKLQLYTSEGLHAKVYATDCQILVTSANLTKNGFEGNIEAGAVATLDASLKSDLDRFMVEQRQRLNETSVEELRNFVRRLRHATIEGYRAKVLDAMNNARKQLSLMAIKEEGLPHTKFPLR